MRRGRAQRSRSAQRGQATVELALVLPLIALFALVVVQAGTVAVDSLLVHHAAREAARAAAVDPTSGAARTAASGATRLDDGRMTVALSGDTSEGGLATATVRYRSPTDIPLVGRLVGDVELSASVTMRVE